MTIQVFEVNLKRYRMKLDTFAQASPMGVNKLLVTVNAGLGMKIAWSPHAAANLHSAYRMRWTGWSDPGTVDERCVSYWSIIQSLSFTG
jgi:hypothetical protein